MKQIVIILIFMCTSMLVESQTLTGGVVYTVESAREAAFSGIEYEISMEPYKEYMKDPGFTAGEGGKKARISKRGRRVVFFSDGSYAVRYYDLDDVFYFTPEGILDEIEISKTNDNYPYLSKKYNVDGTLSRVIYTVDFNESYMYDSLKNLTGHWIGNNCYNPQGQLIDTRK